MGRHQVSARFSSPESLEGRTLLWIQSSPVIISNPAAEGLQKVRGDRWRCKDGEVLLLGCSLYFPRLRPGFQKDPPRTGHPTVPARCWLSGGTAEAAGKKVCKEEGSLCTATRGFRFGTRRAIRIFYIHPALCRGMSPVNLHTASPHHKQLSPFPVLPAGKQGTKVAELKIK